VFCLFDMGVLGVPWGKHCYVIICDGMLIKVECGLGGLSVSGRVRRESGEEG